MAGVIGHPGRHRDLGASAPQPSCGPLAVQGDPTVAIEEYGVNDARAKKLWSRATMREALKSTSFDGLVGSGEDSVVQLLEDTKEGGDRVTINLVMQATGRGTGEGVVQKGNEEALVTYTDNLYIGELGHAHRIPNKGISPQRVPFISRELCRKSLRDWWKTRFDASFFNQICGNTYATDTYYTGMQATIAPSSGRQLWSETGATADSDLDSTGDEFTLAMIDKAVAQAETSTVPIRKARIKGYSDPMYVCFLHPYQTYQLRQGSLGSTMTWAELQKSVLTAKAESDNPVFKGGNFVGIYNGTVLLQSTFVTTGAVTTTQYSNVRRAVFCGAQAAVLAFGKDYGMNQMDWIEDMDDYQRTFGVRASTVFGIKKTVYNSQDFASIVLSSYSPAPS